jgi:hypothetical protein
MACRTHWKKRDPYRILVAKPEGRRPLRRPRRRWVDNIEKDLREIGWGGTDRTGMAQDRDQRRALVNTVINLRFLKNVGEFLSAELLVASQGLRSVELDS